MEQELMTGVGRRSFLVRSAPACAMACLGLRTASAAAGQQAPGAAQSAGAKHPFDEEIPAKFTYRQTMGAMLLGSRLVPLMLFMTKTLGREKTTDLLKQFGAENGAEAGRAAAKQMGGNDFARLKKMFSPEPYKGRLVMEVAESTDTVHQLKITECLWAKTCRDAGAGEQGYAMICFGDFAFAQAFNPRFELVRDKTLMQGDAFCNHRYAVEGQPEP